MPESRCPRSSCRIGVDVGGTFTDIVLESEGATSTAKLLTTHSAPEDAIVEGLRRVCRDANLRLSCIRQIIHGTTLATNALIERKGAKTALITTKGFRDVIEMRTESRFEQYDLNLRLPEPLLPRNCRYVVDERIDATGKILSPLDPSEVASLCTELAAAEYQSVGVGLLHSYVNDSHERQIADALAERLPHVMVSLSSQVSPQMREYERFNTTIANAYVHPLMKSYLDRLRTRLAEEGADCPILLMHSGGGIMSLESAVRFPVRLVESGPAGGAIFASDIANRHGLEKVMSFDMGGTTAKICLITNGTPRTARTFEVARSYRFKKGSGMPISIPVIDMVEIGAGGGSLAHVDAMKRIQVGPESAGSEPGPACYDRGGSGPTVTDADLLLNRIDPLFFAGGNIRLNVGKAERALDSRIGQKLGLNPTKAACALTEVVDENMANAARIHAVENGEDLSGYTMIAFGGAAPLHAARLCEKLGISRCLIPVGAGVGSASGFLRAPFSFETNRTVFMRMSGFDEEVAHSLITEMKEETAEFVRSCGTTAELLSEYKVYMRYSGQGWEIPVGLTAALARNPHGPGILNRFEAEYARLFGRTVEGMESEITVWSVNSYTHTGQDQPTAPVERNPEDRARKFRRILDPVTGRPMHAKAINRAELTPGMKIVGPAAIAETDTTVILPQDRQLTLLSDGCLDMDLTLPSRRNDRHLGDDT